MISGSKSGLKKYKGCAIDIAVSSLGDLWVAGCDNAIYKFIGAQAV